MKRQFTLDGMLVRDAKRNIHVLVIQVDKHKGKRLSPGHCPIAQACSRQLHVKEVRVHASRVYVKTNRFWIRYWLENRDRDALVRYDKGGDFEREKIHLYKPPNRPDERQNKPRGRKTGRNKLRHKLTNVRASPILD